MSNELTLSILGAVVAIGGGSIGVGIYKFIDNLDKEYEKMPSISYSEKMASLTHSLVEASSEVDRVLHEMSVVSLQRESSISELESQLKELSEREKHLQDKVKTLEKVPLPAIEYFVQEVEKGEKRSAWRDYVLFGLGVIVSTITTLLLKLVFGI
jgi:hypothetical protein